MAVENGIKMRTDASAALAIASRRGLGKVRHIEVAQLWLQQHVSDKRIETTKIPGEENLADALTKHVPREKIDFHMSRTGQRFQSGRQEQAPDLTIAAIRTLTANRTLEKARSARAPWRTKSDGRSPSSATP